MARSRQGRTIDRKEWSSTGLSVTEVSTDTTIQGGSLTTLLPATFMRFRGFVSAMFDETVQAGDRMILTFALGVVSADAVSAGAGSLPDPEAEPEYPWIWWGQIHLEAIIAAASWTGFGWGPTAQRLEVDSKAMRKVKPREAISWVMESTATAGAPTVIVTFGRTRVLVGT